jgi:hypothetical protein
MGFFDNIKEALGGERDRPEPSDPPVPLADARHVNRDAPEESQYGPQVTGGKHRA